MQTRRITEDDGILLIDDAVQQRLRLRVRREVVAFLADLSDASRADRGAGTVAFNSLLTYPAGSVGARLKAILTGIGAGQPWADVDALVAALDGLIGDSSLTQTLKDRIALLDAPDTGLVTTVADLQEVFGTTVSAATSAAAAAEAASEAATSKADALQAANAAGVEAGAALESKTAAAASKTAAETAASNANTSSENAATSATSSAGSAATATTKAAAAATSAFQAGESATAAASSQTSAASSATAAGQSATAANTSKLSAETSAASASQGATDAASAATTATGAASTATSKASLAAMAADAAAGSASSSSTSASSASAAADQAVASAAAANSSKLSAETAASGASTSAGSAATSASSASGSASTAGTHASSAATSASAAQGSATAASGSASTASTKADEAATSASAASGSANTASTKAGEALTYRNDAATSASTATGAASTATTQAGIAASAAGAAAGSASAASGSASSASASASSATGSASTATTQAGIAASAASAAAGSASAASGSASSASASASSASGSASAAASHYEATVAATGDLAAEVESLQEAIAGPDGVTAQYVLKATATRTDGKKVFAAVGLAATAPDDATGGQSEILLQADRLLFVPSGDLNAAPANLFVVGVVDGVVTLVVPAARIGDATVTPGKMSVPNLAAINADLGAVTAGTITLNSSGYIRGGQTDYDSGIGFFLGRGISSNDFCLSLRADDGSSLTFSKTGGLQISGATINTSATGPMANAGNSFASMSGIRTGSTVYVGVHIELRRDGTIWKYEADDIMGTQWFQVGNWYLPATSTIGDQYQVMFTRTGGSSNTGFSTSAGSWTDLNASRYVMQEISTTDAVSMDSLGSFQVRRKTDSVVVCSGTWYLSLAID